MFLAKVKQMNNDPGYWMALLPQALNFILYSIASICMAVSYTQLKRVARQSGNKALALLATGFGFYFLSFLVGLLMSAVGLVFAQYLGLIAYRGIQYSSYVFTMIGTVYFVIGAKQFFAEKPLVASK